MPYSYTCKCCEVEFQNKNKGKKYCSQKCAKEDSKRGVMGVCINCQKECYIAAYKTNTRKNKKVFCCFECNMEWQRKRRPVRTCKHCGVEFRKKARPNAMFCTSECKLNSDYNILQLAFMRKKQGGKKINKLEKKGYDLLDELNIKYDPQFIFGERFVADAFLKDYNMILQFDGDYWHGNLNVFHNLTAKQLKQVEIDKRANQTAIALGFKVLRIWESDFKHPEKIKKIFALEIR
jgi:G:T-mismatch repair DNA endonuclease (very short patch repair protein)